MTVSLELQTDECKEGEDLRAALILLFADMNEYVTLSVLRDIVNSPRYDQPRILFRAQIKEGIT